MVEAVIFDFGRVISAQKPESLFRRYERELGLSPGTINDIMFENEEWKQALVGRMTADEYWGATGPRLGLNTGQEIEGFRRRYHADERINDHVRRIIRGLQGRYKLAVCSNWHSGLGRWLEEWEMDRLFDVVFCSGDEGVAKPDAQAYRITLARLGIEPSQAVFIDDAQENVDGASLCGLKAVLFTSGPALEAVLSTML